MDSVKKFSKTKRNIMILLGLRVEAILKATDKSLRRKTTTTRISKYSKDNRLNSTAKQNQLTVRDKSEWVLVSDLSTARCLVNLDYTRYNMTELEEVTMAAIFQIRIIRGCTPKNSTLATVKESHAIKVVLEVRVEITTAHLTEAR